MTKCIAPWVHSYCSPQGERRLCCASREPSTNFKQYIDTNDSMDNKEEVMAFFEKQQTFSIPSLKEHWNSDHMKSVRLRMMNNEVLPECEVCTGKLLNTSVYRDYFEHLFGDKWDEVIANTDPDGHYNGQPVSFDYRFSNLCNFKCRMCGPMLSSSWESEVKKNDEYAGQFHPWMKYKKELANNQSDMYGELRDAIVNKSLEEIYWVGGEPLMFKEHWETMEILVRTGHSSKVYARYNTNLSEIYNKSGHGISKNASLFTVLKSFRDWQVCASIDGTGVIGEYIRTGLDYQKFIKHFEEGLTSQQKPNQMRLDFTLTTPGLFEVRNMFHLSKKYNTQILSKVCFEFDSSVAMCPLWLPKDVLHPILHELIDELTPLADRNQKPLIDVLTNLLARDTMENKYPDDFEEGRRKGKKRIEYLESIRMQPITMIEIFGKHNDAALDFWNDIK